jgi:hypothetical protein
MKRREFITLLAVRQLLSPLLCTRSGRTDGKMVGIFTGYPDGLPYGGPSCSMGQPGCKGVPRFSSCPAG